ncbi:MAG: hypothetical protein J7500_09580 [Sphingomonas sp.]|uniref:hypothetical protein n=1 Tax=Sphingomonas sp. TaxID=28214 RepID=UPI001B2B2DF6|nr:hypothetical protein [Sphingomonas sp.]MBO9622949.1 hypothetical protein [Sphingomonas sp.]
MRRETLFPILLASVALAQPLAAQQAAPATSSEPRRSKEVPVIASGEWTGPRTADGQPDIAGFYSNTISNHSNFTDPEAGPPGEPSKAAALPRDQRAPSRVSDPADGQIPYLPAARALQQDFAKNFPNPTKPRYIEPLARCAPAGVPKSFMWHGFEVRQYPGAVLFLFDSGWRLVRLDDAPRLAPSIKLWNGASRGHWEGNTLVVEVTNNNGKALFGRYGDYMSENGTVAERYVFDNNQKRFNYVATFTDPTVYSRPWTATIPVRRYTAADEPDGWNFDVQKVNAPGSLRYEHSERICAENNGPFGGGAVGVPSDEPVIAR